LGGSPDGERDYVSPASLWYASGEYGYADVTIDGDRAAVVFRNAAGSELKRAVVERAHAGRD
jgi:hypothetical protein